MSSSATFQSPKVSGSVFEPPDSASILPESVCRPLNLLWIWGLPQVLLLLYNLRSFWVVWGEMSRRQHQDAVLWLGLEAGMIAFSTGIAVWHRATKRRLGAPINVCLLAISVGYLWLVLDFAHKLIPTSVAAWILPPEEFFFYQFALVMPAAFFASLLLACTALPFNGWQTGTMTLALLVCTPAVIWVSASIHAYFVGLPVLLAATVLFTVALLRAVTMLYLWLRQRSVVGLAIMSLVVAVAAPIGGLALNAWIPFPWDFQSIGVYIFTAINGLVVCLPNFRHPVAHRITWLAQCASFPFSLYFFAAFLPFLPLGLLLTVLIGAGFLVLAPTALFLVHGERLLDGYRHECVAGMRRPALCGLAALLLVPAFLTAQGLYDRAVLNRALDFAYSPDLRTEARFHGSIGALQRGLDRLRQRKAGVQLPFLSEYYQWLVFDGLVLPDDKVDHLYRLFVGSAPPKLKPTANFFGSDSLGRGRQRTWRTVVSPPVGDVTLTRATVIPAVVTHGGERSKVALAFRNGGAAQGEFVTTLTIPDGVLISGFQLKIGEDLVPGRIFEKKAALWVYQKIRDTERRDPGLLYFTGPNQAELHVFPVAQGEERQVELEFLYPAGLHPSVTVGSQSLELGAPAGDGFFLAENDGGAGTVVVSAEGSEALPSVRRVPYLHFIVEQSGLGSIPQADLPGRLEALARRFPQATECVVSVANFEMATADGLQPLANLRGGLKIPSLPARGGFATDRAVKRAALWYEAHASGDAGWAGRFPLFIAVRAAEADPVDDGGVGTVGKLVPDVDGYVLAGPNDTFTWRPWAAVSSKLSTEGPAIHPVFVLRSGQSLAAARAEKGEGAMIPLPRRSAGAPLQALAALPDRWQEVAATAALPPQSEYSRAVDLWLSGRAQELNPALAAEGLGELIKRSRAERVLVPASSFIVVENSAQWKMLSEAERKKLGANQALEFSESVPEPGTAGLLLVSGGALLMGRWRRISGRK